MNKKVTCSIVLGIAVSAFSTFAAEDSASLRTELDALNQRLDAMEKESNPTPAWIDKINNRVLIIVTIFFMTGIPFMILLIFP